MIENLEIDGRFNWRLKIEADRIVREGVLHNDYPTQIMLSLEQAGIQPLPTSIQLNNRVTYLRKSLKEHIIIETTQDLRKEIEERLVEPEDPHEPFVHAYNIEIMLDGVVKFWLNLTTKNLIHRLQNNPL